MKKLHTFEGFLNEARLNEKDTKSLIVELRNELNAIREKYQGKLTRNTIRDEFKEQTDKV